jgi:hypothetical protein
MMLTALTTILALQAPAAAQAPPTASAPDAPVVTPQENRSNAALQEAVARLAERYPARITTRTLGQSAGGTAIPLLVLASDPALADTRPGLLVVAGLEGARWSTTEAALVLAETLAKGQAELLDTVTVYVVPRANPDAAAFSLGVPRRDYSGNAIEHDNDRDRRGGENPPQDLNGDGLITLMRVRDAVAPYANPTLVADAADPRILRAPDAARGETPQYTVFVEGLDTDGDGRIAEDGPGGVVPDRNFPHRWPEFEDEAGAYPLIAPEAAALADFVIGHPGLAGAFVMGRLDTVVNVPDGKARAEGGTPAMITEEDAKAYGVVAKAYRDIVGQTRATEADSSGSFVAWMNAQRGVPTVAAQLWGRPDAPAKPAGGEGSTPEGKPSTDGAPAPTGGAGAPPASEGSGARDASGPPAGGRGGARGGARGRAPGPPPRAPTAGERVDAANPDDAAWLALSDANGGAGFVAWTPFKHPQLGDVEIGGWVPGWRENVPLQEVRSVGEKCAAFVAALAEHRARVELRTPKVTMLGPGLYRVETSLANVGQLPSIQQGGRAGSVVPVERVKSGQRMTVVRGMTPGEVRRMQWVVAAAPEEVVELELLFMGRPLRVIQIRNGEVLR